MTGQRKGCNKVDSGVNANGYEFCHFYIISAEYLILVRICILDIGLCIYYRYTCVRALLLCVPHICRCLQRPEKDATSFGHGFIGICELFDVDTGNQTKVHCKNSKHFNCQPIFLD